MWLKSGEKWTRVREREGLYRDLVGNYAAYMTVNKQNDVVYKRLP